MGKARREAEAQAQAHSAYGYDYEDDAAADRAEIAREMMEQCRGDIEYSAWKGVEEYEDAAAAAAPVPRGGYSHYAAPSGPPAAKSAAARPSPAVENFPVLGGSAWQQGAGA